MHCIQTLHCRLRQFATAACDLALVGRKASVALFTVMTLLAPSLFAADPAMQVWVNQAYGPSSPNDGHVWGYDAFSSIQNAVNGVGAGGTVNVAAGTFVEQLNIGQDITVTGQGSGTVIQSPAALAVNYNYLGTDNRAVVFIHDTANAVLQNLTVDGAAQGNANHRFLGVSFYHAGGKALNLAIQGVRRNPFDGVQSGVGLYAENRGEATLRNVEVAGCQITDCQKGGMAFNGNVAVNAHDNRVTGVGPTGQIAQNGIQVGYGASGTVANNEIRGFAYTGADEAAGILVYQAGATISGNLLANNQEAVSAVSPTAAMGPVTLNNFAGSQTGVSCTGDGTVNALSNWWGSASGPRNASNPGGNGVVAGNNVLFSPWLGETMQVWVNLSYGPSSPNDGHLWGYDAFSSIQDAVNGVIAGGIVDVAPGTYNERVVVNKAGLTVRGAGAASVVTGTASAPASGVTPAVFKVAANGVTISNFMIQVNFAYNHSGVHSSGMCSGLTVSGNTIVASGTPAFSYGLRNAIAVNPSITVAGYTSVNGGYSGVSVTGNTIQGTGSTYFRAGIQMDYCGGIVSGNTSTTVNHDFISRFASQGDLTVTNNTFLGGGAQFGSFDPGAGTVTISDNVFDNAIMQPASGPIGTSASLRLIYYAEVNSVNNNVVVSGNTFRNHRWGVSVEDFKNVAFDNNTFTPKAGATDFIHMTFNTKVVTSTSADAALNMFPVAATLTRNTFNGSGSAGGTALAFYNHRSSGAVFGTYTIGTPGNENTFNAGIASFVRLDASSGASSSWAGFGEYSGIASTTMAPWAADLDVQNNQFDVGGGLTLPAAMTTADLFEAENRIQHKVDNSALGLVRLKGANLFVTQSSGSIQRGIDAATAGDTVNVAAGTFVEQLNIGKDITVTGQGAETVIQSPANLAVNYGDYQAVVFIHDTANAVLQNLAVDGAARGDTSKRFVGVSFYHASGKALNLTVKNIKLSDPALFGMQTGYGIYADNRAGAGQCQVEVGGCVIADCQKGGIYFAGAVVANAHENRVTGAGATGQIAQNGIVLLSGASGSVVNNEISGFAYTGVDEACGILVYQAGATISGNVLVNNQDAVCVVSPTAAMGPITLNNFAGCQNGVSYEGTDVLQAPSNWWGSTSGPNNALNPGGNGALASNGVNFNPWLADGSDTQPEIMGFQPNSTLVNLAAPAQVWVDQAYGSSQGNDGHLWGYNAFNTIQAAIDGVAVNGTVNVAAGTYSENVVLARPLELAGSGQTSTVIVPAISNPIGSGGDCDVFGGGTASIVFLVQASDVKIHDLTVDGNNPNLTSGIVRGGVDIDARVGILTDNRNGTFDRLDVRNVTVRNIYLRGIQNLYGSDINIVSNTVQNVWGSTDCSIGIFNRNGSGVIACNTVSGAPDAISANHSRGTRFLTNTVALSASGIHTDNNGDAGGLADVIKGNLVLDGMPDSSGNAYGIWVFAPYTTVVVEGNTVSNVLYGLSALGQGASAAPIFTGNTVLGTQAAGGVGICVDTSYIGGWGSANVEAVLAGNFVSNHVTGVLLKQEAGYTASLIASNNCVTANGVGIDLNAGLALLQDNNLTANTEAAIRLENGARLDAGDCGSGLTALGTSTGGNNLSGYGFDNSAPWAIENLNPAASPALLALHNNFGALAGDSIAAAFQDPNQALQYSQAAAVLSAPAMVTVSCVSEVPAGATDLAGFVAQGGYFSASAAASVSFNDTAHPTGNGAITRTYTVTDVCGAVSLSSQTIVVNDTTPPVISSLADATVTTAQPRDPYFTGTPTATDTCGAVTLSYSDDRSGLTGCNGSGFIVRTWTATDAAGNVSTGTQKITVTDAGVLEFANVPANIVVNNDPGQCSAVVNFAQLTAKVLSFSQGFEEVNWTSGGAANNPSVDWNQYSSAIDRVASGTDGIASRSGEAHAVIDSTGLQPGEDSGVFSRLGGYSAVFGAGYRVAQEVYLNLNDPAVGNNTYGWDLSAASSAAGGGYGRDFVFHVASDNAGQLLVGANNGSDFAKPNYLASVNHHTVTASGWYTFEWVFRDQAGVLAVDCNLRDAAGALLWSQTLSAPSDLIANMGGNRYLWFTYLAVDKLAIDNTVLERNVPVSTDHASGGTFPVGTTPVSWTATDACGNSTTTSFTVTVKDTEAPVIACPANIVQAVDPNQGFATVNFMLPAGSDNCAVDTVVATPASGSQFEVGTNVVTVLATDIHGNQSSNSFTVAVIGLPGIVAQPASCTNLAGTTVTFAIEASSPAPLSYQWLKDGSPIADATDATLTLNNVQDGDAASYKVEVRNMAGKVVSAEATLTVFTPPLIVGQPASQVGILGRPVSFTVGINAQIPFTCQWQKDGVAIPNATNRIFTLDAVSSADAGSYRVEVTNPLGSETSSSAVLVVAERPVVSLLSYANGKATVDVRWVSGYPVVIEASTTLGNWVPVHTNTAPYTWVDTDAGTLGSRFYRAVYVP